MEKAWNMSEELDESLSTLKEQVMIQHPVLRQDEYNEPETIRSELCMKIEEITEKVIRNLSEDISPIVEIPVHTTSLTNSVGDLGLKILSVRFEKDLPLLLHLLSKVHRLLLTRTASTRSLRSRLDLRQGYCEGIPVEVIMRDCSNHSLTSEGMIGCVKMNRMHFEDARTDVERLELYYQEVTLMGCQKRVDVLIHRISCLLSVPQWLFNVHITSKGLVHGPLTIHTRHHALNCATKPGVMVPQDLLNVRFESSAKFILVVEKDAIYQKLLDEDFPNRHGPCILVTGKGVPDANTRYLLGCMWKQLSIPVLGLFDADPYGLEIMCCYRYGSRAMCHLREDLSLPCMRWIGVHPTDLRKFSITTLPLNDHDRRKTNSLLRRRYIQENPQLLAQVEEMMESGVKAEIEGVFNISLRYLTDVYLPMKIIYKQYY